jgi:hypothetical protein
MVRTADHLRVVQFQSPVWADMDRDDVVDVVRGGDPSNRQADLAQVAIGLTALLGHALPGGVVPKFAGGRTAVVEHVAARDTNFITAAADAAWHVTPTRWRG